MSLIQGTGGGLGGAGAPGGALGNFYSHLLDQSLKFNDDDSQYLTRTPASAGNRKTWTWSGWVKRGNLGVTVSLMDALQSSGTDWTRFHFNSSDKLAFAVEISNSNIFQFVTTQVFRDTSAWYHIVAAYDSTQTTSTNRFKLYVNGEQITAFDTETYGAQNTDSHFSAVLEHNIGAVNTGIWFFDGYMAEINLIDGTALTAASFGETKDGIWIPKDTSGLTFGTNGFHLTFKDDVVSEGFNTVTYSGKGAVQSVNGLGFSPAMVWTKERDGTSYHEIHDIVRGPNKQLFPNENDAPESATKLSSFDGDGFTLAAHNSINESGKDYVGWCWEAGGTPTADNSAGAGATPTAGSVKIDGSNLGSALAGSIAATRLSANTAKGFSVVGYPGNGSAGATVAHGLGATPKWIILKWLGGASNWRVHHTSVGTGHTLFLNRVDDKSTDADRISGVSSTTFTLSEGNAAINGSGSDYIAYCWAEISGYSKFGTYEGSGSDGNAVACGFEPAFLMIKNIDTDNNWIIFDNTRSPAPPQQQMLRANTEAIESTVTNKEPSFTSTGFTIGDNDTVSNRDGDNYIFMAFADTREAAFFKDVTTNGNHWTPTNLDYRDSVPDTPTNNFCTLNSALSDSHFNTDQLSEGNLFYNEGEGNDGDGHPTATFSVTSGKWYWEAQVPSQQNSRAIGFTRTDNIGKGNVELHGNGLSAANSVVGIDLSDDTIDQVDKAGTHTQHASGLTGMANNDIFGFSVDLDGGTFQMYRNGSAYGSSYNLDDLADWQKHGMTPTATGDTYMAYRFNFGQDSSFAGNHATANSNADGNGHGSFAYAPPSGYLALCSQNLPDVDIIDGTDNFNTVLYTGNAGTQSITGVGFDPDFTWAKNRASASYHHELYDTVRGDNKRIFSSQTDVEATGYLQFISDGFSLTSGGGINANSNNHVAWNWKAGGAAPSQTYTVKVVSDSGNKYRFDDFGTSAVTLNLQEGGTYTFDQSDSSNSGHPLRFSTTSDGTHGSGSEYTTGVTTTGTPGNAGAKTVITVAASAATLYYYCSSHSGMGGQANTNSTRGSTNLKGNQLSTVLANTTAGFSIVSWQFTTSVDNLVGHGLSSAPEMMLLKSRTTAYNWDVYHTGLSNPATKRILLNTTGAEIAGFFDTNPTSTVFEYNTSALSNNDNAIAYCFHSVEGYSKVGSYVGNGSADGTFVYTGFRPSWIMIKKSSAAGTSWYLLDNKRDIDNPVENRLIAEGTNAEGVGSDKVDFLSNGFKLRENASTTNHAATYIYLAFADQPFKFANAE